MPSLHSLLSHAPCAAAKTGASKLCRAVTRPWLGCAAAAFQQRAGSAPTATCMCHHERCLLPRPSARLAGTLAAGSSPAPGCLGTARLIPWQCSSLLFGQLGGSWIEQFSHLSCPSILVLEATVVRCAGSQQRQQVDGAKTKRERKHALGKAAPLVAPAARLLCAAVAAGR